MVSELSHRVLVVAPVGRDAHLLCVMLRRNRITCQSCADVRQLCGELRGDTGAILLTEEALGPGAIADLSTVLGEQPQWSDLPVILLTRNGQRVTTVGRQIFRGNLARGNLIIVEKPVRPFSLLSTVDAALTARRRQYELRDYLEERTRAAKLVPETKEQLEMILDSTPDQFIALGPDWRFTYLNKHSQAQMRRLGKQPEHLIGKVLWKEFPEVPNAAAIRRVMTERIPITDELYYAPLGEWVENHMFPSANGGMVTFQRYITERKRAEEDQHRIEAYLAEGQRLSHTGSWAWNVSSGALFWSDEHFRIFRVEPGSEKLSYPNDLRWIHPDDRSFVQQSFNDAVREKNDFVLDCRIVRPDGIRYVHSLGHPVFSAAGELTEYVGTIIDYTERKRAEEALQKAQAELARVTRLVTIGELTASIAHEINQPLAGLVSDAAACLRWLGRDVPELDEVRKCAKRIIEEGMRAGSVIKGIRSLVKNAPSDKERLNVNEMIQEVCTLVASELILNGVVLRMELQPDIPAVMGDRVQLQQVLLNLILNANEAMGAVDWKMKELVITTEECDHAEMMVSVRDSGVGFAPHDAERMFNSFFSTKEGGLGLGLSISRTIVENHGGRIWATLNDVNGATFHFTVVVSAT